MHKASAHRTGAEAEGSGWRRRARKRRERQGWSGALYAVIRRLHVGILTNRIHDAIQTQ